MKWRWIVVVGTATAVLWGLIFVGELGEGTPPAQAALGTTVLLALAGVLGGLVIAGIEWAMRGDR